MRFYPPEMKKGHLAFLATEFNTVEINSSFYRLPLRSTFEKWALETPEDFTFAVKLSRPITHYKKLEGVRGELEAFIKHAEPMREKLGAILVQLPPSLKFDTKLIAGFIEDIKVVRGRNYPVRIALEPRNLTWMAPEEETNVRAMLREAGIALVFAQSKKIPSFAPIDESVTADFIYLRFHGPEAFAASGYGEDLLKPWAERMQKWRRGGKNVFAYFNNTTYSHALEDSRTLKQMLMNTATRSK